MGESSAPRTRTLVPHLCPNGGQVFDLGNLDAEEAAADAKQAGQHGIELQVLARLLLVEREALLLQFSA